MQVHGSMGHSAIGGIAEQPEVAVDPALAASEGGPLSLSRGLAFGMVISLVLWAAILALILRL